MPSLSLPLIRQTEGLKHAAEEDQSLLLDELSARDA